MKDITYYTGENTLKAPSKENYTSYYFYKQGKVLSVEDVEKAIGAKLEERMGLKQKNAITDQGITVEFHFDENSYKVATSEYHLKKAALREEFKKDLLTENAYEIGDPVGEVIFKKASQDASLYETIQNFEDLDSFVYDIKEALRRKGYLTNSQVCN